MHDTIQVPCDPHLEDCTLASLVATTPAVRAVAIPMLSVEHFYSRRSREIFGAIEYLHAEGREPHAAEIAGRLTDIGRLGDAGGVQGIVDMLGGEYPLTHDLPGLTRRLDELRRRRALILALQEHEARARAGAVDASASAAAVREAVDAIERSDRRRGMPVIGAAEMAQPLPELPWLVDALGLAPGPIIMVAGYGYSRKTLALQSMALSVAYGLPVWGLWRCRRGPVLHIDYEQGARLTRERYQRLARGMGRELADLDAGDLEVSPLPPMYLDQRGIESAITRASEGKALVIVDSLRAGCLSLDENSSEAAAPLTMLSRVSERTGATVVVVHHAKKPSKDDKGGKYAVRGSGALFAACAGVFIFSGEKGKPTEVSHEKERNRGKAAEQFFLDSEDVASPDGRDRFYGLRVKHLSKEQADEQTEIGDFDGALRDQRRTDVRVLAAVAAAPGMATSDIASAIKRSKADVSGALARLMSTGRVAEIRDGSLAVYRAIG